ncbi:unnamed protein product, partial [Nesidiocoris tenuis]
MRNVRSLATTPSASQPLLKDASLFCAHATSHAERKHSELLGLNCGGSEQIAEAARTRATCPG